MQQIQHSRKFNPYFKFSFNSFAVLLLDKFVRGPAQCVILHHTHQSLAAAVLQSTWQVRGKSKLPDQSESDDTQTDQSCADSARSALVYYLSETPANNRDQFSQLSHNVEAAIKPIMQTKETIKNDYRK